MIQEHTDVLVIVQVNLFLLSVSTCLSVYITSPFTKLAWCNNLLILLERTALVSQLVPLKNEFPRRLLATLSAQ